MKKKLFWGLVITCSLILVISFGNQLFTSMFNLAPKSGLKITSTPEAVVFINGMEVGKTPYQDENLSVGEYLIKLTADNFSWQGRIKLTKGTLSVINRLLAPGVASSSGESLVLDKGEGAVFTSNPSGTGVEIDGKVIGLTPLSVSSLAPGEHNISLNHDGYVKKNISVTLPPDAKLYINADLAMNDVKLNIAPTPTIAIVQKALIKQTPLGYLRVREKPSIASREIGQVSSGDELTIAEEVPGWVKIILKDNQEGYISTQYIQKITQ